MRSDEKSAPKVAIVSFRLGLADGVSIVAKRWAEAFDALGYEVETVAGDGSIDHRIPGLAIGAPAPPDPRELAAALDDVDLVAVENLCTIPMNLPASRVVGEYLRGRPAIMHHHDPPWQREHYGHVDELPMLDPAWRHVTINELTRHQMATRGIDATTIYNPFLTEEPPGDRAAMRAELGVADDDLVVAHPVRAIARKNIPVALRLAEELDGVYWLLGDAEDGYDRMLDWLVSTARVPVRRRPCSTTGDIYAAADVVVFPSLWEGFGNPPIEAAIHRRPVIVGDYPVADEMVALGFEWFHVDQVNDVARSLRDPDDGYLAMLERNRAIALEHFSMQACQQQLAALIAEAGWT